ncbi:hypothetical protein AGMMS50267_03680 [Spirochaetia bacterium]|nr:hypothetical protein AGMMS50267_03680 [Spirochaetia bacterium]
MKMAFPRFLVSLLGILFLAGCTAMAPPRNDGPGENQGKAPAAEETVPVDATAGEAQAAEPGASAPGSAAAVSPGTPAPGTPRDTAQTAPRPGETAAPAGTGTVAAGTAAEVPGSVADGPAETAAGSGEAAVPAPPVSGGDSNAVTGEGGGSNAVAENAPAEKPAKPVLSPEQNVLDMDIRTSTLNELAAWCRSLGISEGGSRDDLAIRLRDYFELPGSAADPQTTAETSEAPKSKKKNIVIESARSTEYFTLEVVDEEYARLRGDVIISLKDGEAVHRIKAAEILYNRSRNIMSASGGVEYVKEDGGKTETYRGDSITVNLDNWSSVLMDSVSERSMSNDETVYRFAGSLITRSDEEATIMTRAVITNPNNDASYGSTWSISASKLWLLPGSDWAILNAVLKVGEIPVLYIPAFFFPADEIIFHPVLGSRTRWGAFLQTTTYILGRPTASSSAEASSISKILGTNLDDEKKREGIFLRSTGKKSQDPNDTRLSVLMDVYANLGGYLGTELALPAKSPFGPLNISAGVGFTRTVYKGDTSSYTPFKNNDGESDWNSAHFFSNTIPVRFRFTASNSVQGTYGSFNWSLPFYSDPKVDTDFLDRSEEMDWVSLLKKGNNTEETTTSDSSTGLQSYVWTLGGSVNPKIQVLSPYISSLSISSISSTLSFLSKHPVGSSITAVEDPNYYFFYPATFTIASINTSISGMPLSLGGTAKAVANTNDTPEEPEDPFKGIGVPRSPWDTEDTAAKAAAENAALYDFKPPVLNTRFELPRTGGNTKFTIDYWLNPSGASQLNFRSSDANWKEPEDVNWSEISSVLTTFKSDATTTFTLTDSGTNAYTVSLKLTGTGQYQDYSFINEEAEEFLNPSNPDDKTKINAALQQVYKGTWFTTSGESNVTVKPFFWSTMWANTSLQYSLRGLIAKSVYKDVPAADLDPTQKYTDPSYDIEKGDLKDKDKIDTHKITANLSALVRDKAQTLSLSTDLPPEDATFSANATMNIWKSTTTVGGQIVQPFKEDERKFNPINFSESLTFYTGYSAQQSFTYDPELKEFTNLNSSLTLKDFRATYTMNRIKAFELDIDKGGWIVPADATEKLNPVTLNMSYSKGFGQEKLWQERFSWRVNITTSMNFDLQRYTYSKLTFGLGVTLGITKFLNLTLSTTSENAVIMRYFQQLVDLPIELPGEKNPFLDLVNSFRFDDRELRKQSGYKIKSFNLNLVHHLGDWDATLIMSVIPRLNSTTRKNEINTDISFLIKWIPISEIKTDLQYKDTGTEKTITKR